MRQLERERLGGLSVGPDEERAAAPDRTSAPADDQGGNEDDWRRRLARDRMSMQAMEEATSYPGPGAVGASDAMAMAKAGQNPAEAAQAVAQGMRDVKDVMPILQQKQTLWGMVPTWFIAVPLIMLPLHKVQTDAKVKRAARNIKQAVKKAGIPLPPQAALIVKISPWLPSIEWLLLLSIYGAIALLMMSMLAIIGIIACASTSLSCAGSLVWALGKKIVSIFNIF